MPSVSAVQIALRVDPRALPALKEPDEARRRAGAIPSGVANPNAVAIRFLRVNTLPRSLGAAPSRLGSRPAYNAAALLRLRATLGRAAFKAFKGDAHPDDTVARGADAGIKLLSSNDVADDDGRLHQDATNGRLRARGLRMLGVIPTLAGPIAVIDFAEDLERDRPSSPMAVIAQATRLRAQRPIVMRPGAVSAVTRTAVLRGCPALRAARLRVTQRLQRGPGAGRASLHGDRRRIRPLGASFERDARPRHASITARLLTRGYVRRWPPSETFSDVRPTAVVSARFERRRDYLWLPLLCVATPSLPSWLQVAGPRLLPRTRWTAPGPESLWA